MELHTIPCISTSHLTKEVAARLTKDGDKNPWCACAAWEYGFFLHLDDLETAPEDVPQCLIDIRDWLREKNLPCTDGDQTFRSDWVRLDQSCDEVPELPTYNW